MVDIRVIPPLQGIAWFSFILGPNEIVEGDCMSASPKTVPASDQLWSCVGSAGVVDVADFGKVQFVGSIVKMTGSDGTTTAHAKVPAAIKATKVQAVVRYEIDPVEG